ncbi:Molecular chaperone, partial [Dysosmobacter welbionis]
GGHTGGHPLLQLRHFLDVPRLRRYQIADPPAGHGIGLGEAVQHHHAVLHLGHLGHAVRLDAVVYDGVIGLVCQHPQVMGLRHLGDGQDVLLRQHRAGGIAG